MAEDGNKQSTLTEKAKLTEKDITGLKYFDQIAPLLQRLHDDACDRDTAGNRTLHYDQYCMLMLLYFFNPIVTSLRGLQQASELKNVQTKLGCARASLGSLSEATTVFDAERLKDIISELGQQLQPLAQDQRLQYITASHGRQNVVSQGSLGLIYVAHVLCQTVLDVTFVNSLRDDRRHSATLTSGFAIPQDEQHRCFTHDLNILVQHSGRPETQRHG